MPACSSVDTSGAPLLGTRSSSIDVSLRLHCRDVQGISPCMPLSGCVQLGGLGQLPVVRARYHAATAPSCGDHVHRCRGRWLLLLCAVAVGLLATPVRSAISAGERASLVSLFTALNGPSWTGEHLWPRPQASASLPPRCEWPHTLGPTPPSLPCSSETKLQQSVRGKCGGSVTTIPPRAS